MIMQKMSLVAFGTAGFLVGGTPGVAAVMAPWALLIVASKRLREGKPKRTSRAPAVSGKRSQHPAYANITDVIERLEDIAKQGNWDLDKRLEIARMACENPDVTFDALERGYDRGLRSVLDKARKNTPDGPANPAYDDSDEPGSEAARSTRPGIK